MNHLFKTGYAIYINHELYPSEVIIISGILDERLRTEYLVYTDKIQKFINSHEQHIMFENDMKTLITVKKLRITF